MMTRRILLSARLLSAVSLIPFGFACSSSGGTDAGTGGFVGTGGLVATGGTASGGTTATGGTTSGGTPATGGASGGATGGAGKGGASTGGAFTAGAGQGGTAAGGSPAGGSSANGGKGGAPGGSGGSGGAIAGNGGKGGGASSGGSGGGGSGGGASQGKGSLGCGSPSPLKSGNLTETIDGTSRKFVLDVPSGYDTNKPYRLIFVWHPLGGSADQVVSDGYNGLKSLSSGGAIFVAAEGMDGSNDEASGRGWWNVNDRDMKLLTAMLARIQMGLCVDQDRIFSTGFSFGGMMSYAVGYEFDVFRAIAPCSGDMQVIQPDNTYTRPLPIMAFHGNNDTFVTTARGRAARDKYLMRNQCGTQTQPVAPSPCVQYQGCGAPTFWCEFPGGHNTWSEQPQAIWKFFSQF